MINYAILSEMMRGLSFWALLFAALLPFIIVPTAIAIVDGPKALLVFVNQIGHF